MSQMSSDPSEIILICRFAAVKKIVLITAAYLIFWGKRIDFIISGLFDKQRLKEHTPVLLLFVQIKFIIVKHF